MIHRLGLPKFMSFCVATSMALAIAPAGNCAAAYPERPVRWIVPAAAGGGADTSARIYAQEMTRLLGQQIIIDNRPGASGTIGIGVAAKADPDGYTWAAGNSTNIVMNRPVVPKLSYDPDKNLRAVVQTHFQPNMLVVNPSLPVKSVVELIELARKSPGKLLFASSGNGSSLHYAGELFRMLAQVEIAHVPYKSITVAVNDLLGNRIHLIFDNMTSAESHVQAGRLRALGVTSAKRSPAMPDVPTIAESGLKNYVIGAWSGIVVPAGTPDAIVKQINAAANEMLRSSAVTSRLSGLGVELVGGTPEEFAAFIRAEVVKWGEVARKANIRP